MLEVLVDLYTPPETVDLSETDAAYVFFQEEGPVDFEEWQFLSAEGELWTVAQLLAAAEEEGFDVTDRTVSVSTLDLASGKRVHGPIPITREDVICMEIAGFLVICF